MPGQFANLEDLSPGIDCHRRSIPVSQQKSLNELETGRAGFQTEPNHVKLTPHFFQDFSNLAALKNKQL
jgi:hypothetical protein